MRRALLSSRPHLGPWLALRAAAVLGAVLVMSGIAQAQTPSETIEYYGTDAIGSIRLVFDVNGQVLGRQDYGPFGRELFPAPQLPTERFGGQQAD